MNTWCKDLQHNTVLRTFIFFDVLAKLAFFCIYYCPFLERSWKEKFEKQSCHIILSSFKWYHFSVGQWNQSDGRSTDKFFLTFLIWQSTTNKSHHYSHSRYQMYVLEDFSYQDLNISFRSDFSSRRYTSGPIYK